MNLIYLLLTLTILSSSYAQVNNWRQENGIYEVYGVTLEKFFEIHPFTLLLIYDDSEMSKDILDYLPKLQAEFISHKFGTVVAKMRKGDGPRWLHNWSVYQLPYFRLCFGEEVSTSTRMFLSYENVFNWVDQIQGNTMRIINVDSKKIKEEFMQESNAFYLRYDPSKTNYFEMLTKFQKIDKSVKVYYATNPAYDVFDNYKKDDVVIGFKRNFEDPIKYLSSPDKLNADNIHQFFHTYREPQLNDLTPELLDLIFTKKIRSAFFVSTNSDPKLLEAFKFVAFEQKANILFVVGVLADLDDQKKEELFLKNTNEVQIRIITFEKSATRVYEIEGSNLSELSDKFHKFNMNGLIPMKRDLDYPEEL